MANQIEIHLYQKSPSSSEAAIRQHRVTVDRPMAKGGEDTGPMGGELFLAAIGGCFMSTLLAAIRTREAPISGVSAKVTGTLADAPARFASIELLVTSADAAPDVLGKLVDIAERGCIMMNTLRDKLEITIGVGDFAAARAPVSGPDR
jgi:putative redox protein